MGRNLRLHGCCERFHAENMHGHSRGDEEKKTAQPPGLRHPDNRVPDHEPEQDHREYLRAHGDRVEAAVIADESSENAVVGDPKVKPAGAAHEQPGRQEEEGGGRQYGNEDTKRAKQQTGKAGGNQQIAFRCLTVEQGFFHVKRIITDSPAVYFALTLMSNRV